MRTLILIAITALAFPVLGFAQTTTEPQQTQEQTKEQAKEPQATAPAQKGKTRSAQKQDQTQAKPEASADVQGRAHETKKDEHGARSSTSQTSATSHTQVNPEEFKSRHSEVFHLGRHPKEFFVQRYGAEHFHLIGNTYFVFVDTCWVAVDVDGFTYAERIICPGDPDYIEVY